LIGLFVSVEIWFGKQLSVCLDANY
jgi:hypothetical protein